MHTDCEVYRTNPLATKLISVLPDDIEQLLRRRSLLYRATVDGVGKLLHLLLFLFLS